MSTGTAAGAACFPSQAEAAAAWCSSFASVNSGTGTHYTCSGVVSGASPAVGGAASFVWTRRALAADGSVSSVEIQGQSLQPCEAYDWEYWQPLSAAFVAALVVVWCLRYLYRFFAEDRRE